MPITLSADFKREAGQSGSSPVFIVDIGGLTGGRFVMGARSVLGYPANIIAMNTQSSSIDPVSGEQSLSSATIDFLDDGLVRALVAANNIVGKNITIYLGFDTGNDATFAFGSFAQVSLGVIDKYVAIPGTISLVATDIRSVIWKRLSSTMIAILPGEQGAFDPATGNEGASGTADPSGTGPYRAEGLWSYVLRELLARGGIPHTWISNATFTAASLPATGHLVVDRRRIPDSTNYYHYESPGYSPDQAPGEPCSDRRIQSPTPIAQCARELLQVTRTHLLVREAGLLELVEHTPSAAATDRFVESEIVPGSMKVWLDQSNIMTNTVISSAWEGLKSVGGPDFRMIFRDQDTAAESAWAFTDTTARKADFSLQDPWFSGTIWRDRTYPNVLIGDTTIYGIWSQNNNFTGNGSTASAPAAVSASLPMYLWIWGRPTSGSTAYVGTGGEVIKVTSVVTNADGSFTFGGITRGMFGTTARQHGNAGGATPGGLAGLFSDVFMVDITAVARCGDMVLREFKDGATLVEFQTGLNKFGIQVPDIVNLETDVYLANGQNGLPVGNVIKFKVLGKDLNPVTMTITWLLLLLNNPTRTIAIPPGGIAAIDKPGNTGARPGIATGFETMFAQNEAATNAGQFTNAFVRGEVPATSASLLFTIPEQTHLSPSGIVRMPQGDWTVTASRDTYFDLRPIQGGLSAWIVTAVPNGYGAPNLGSTLDQRAFKVVSSGTAVTSVTDLRAVAAVGTSAVVPGAVTDTLIAPTRSLVSNFSVDSPSKRLNLGAGSNAIVGQLPGTNIADRGITVDSLGEWFDQGYFGDGADGDLVVSSGTTTITADKAYMKLDVNGASTKFSAQSNRILVRERLTVGAGASNAGMVHADGAGGGNAVGATAGTGQAAVTGMTLIGGFGGSGGGNGGPGTGGVGAPGGASAGSIAFTSLGGVSGTGGHGGDTVAIAQAGGAGGGPGTLNVSKVLLSIIANAISLQDAASSTVPIIRGGAGGAGGGGGGGYSTGALAGGGGGGGGSGAGLLWIAAREIDITAVVGSGVKVFSAKGAVGGNGGNSAGANSGCGAGASGSGGGLIVIICRKVIGGTRADLLALCDVSGGQPGSNGTGNAANATAGTVGGAGNVFLFVLSEALPLPAMRLFPTNVVQDPPAQRRRRATTTKVFS